MKPALGRYRLTPNPPNTTNVVVVVTETGLQMPLGNFTYYPAIDLFVIGEQDPAKRIAVECLGNGQFRATQGPTITYEGTCVQIL